MYWLRWHDHVKDIAGAPYKIRQKKTNKMTESPTVSSRGQTNTVQYNHDRLVSVKRPPKKYGLQLATERRQRQCIPDRRWQAVPRTCRSHWEGTNAERWTFGGRYDQHGCVSRTQTASSIDIRCMNMTLQQLLVTMQDAEGGWIKVPGRMACSSITGSDVQNRFFILVRFLKKNTRNQFRMSLVRFSLKKRRFSSDIL